MERIIGSPQGGLVAQAKTGDSEAFARLVEPYLPAALSSARLILGGSGDASDVVQDAYLAARGQFLEHAPYCERDQLGPTGPLKLPAARSWSFASISRGS